MPLTYTQLSRRDFVRSLCYVLKLELKKLSFIGVKFLTSLASFEHNPGIKIDLNPVINVSLDECTSILNKLLDVSTFESEMAYKSLAKL